MSSFPSLNSTTLTALRQLGSINLQTNRSAQRLATGFRINRGADDPAGIIASERLRADLRALEAESNSLQRVDNVAATADAALDEVSRLTRESNALQTQLANDGFSADEKAAIQQQIDFNNQAVDRNSSTTTFNGQRLLDGSVTLTAGADSLDLPDTSTTSLGEMDISGTTFRLSDIGSGGALDGDPASSQLVTQNAISDVATARGRIGAFQSNVIRTSINSIGVAIENPASAESRIRDTNFASETANFARLSTIRQASLLALSVSNDSERGALDIFG